MNQNNTTNKIPTQVGNRKYDMFPHFLATAIFEDLEDKTKITYSSVFDEKEDIFDKVKTYAVPGAEQTMDRLEEHLASMLQK